MISGIIFVPLMIYMIISMIALIVGLLEEREFKGITVNDLLLNFLCSFFWVFSAGEFWILLKRYLMHYKLKTIWKSIMDYEIIKKVDVNKYL